MGDNGHNYRFAPPKGGWPIFDKQGRRIDERASFHKLVVLTKAAQPPLQRRTFFMGVCACGWESEKWRTTKERAEADYRKEHEEAA